MMVGPAGLPALPDLHRVRRRTSGGRSCCRSRRSSAAILLVWWLVDLARRRSFDGPRVVSRLPAIVGLEAAVAVCADPRPEHVHVPLRTAGAVPAGRRSPPCCMQPERPIAMRVSGCGARRTACGRVARRSRRRAPALVVRAASAPVRAAGRAARGARRAPRARRLLALVCRHLPDRGAGDRRVQRDSSAFASTSRQVDQASEGVVTIQEIALRRAAAVRRRGSVAPVSSRCGRSELELGRRTRTLHSPLRCAHRACRDRSLGCP